MTVREISSKFRQRLIDGKPIVGMYTPDLAEITGWRTAGASLFLLDSDQGFMLGGANALAERLRQ